MLVLEWAIVAAVSLGFVIVMLFSWSDLLKDLKFYRNKSKNVRQLKAHKKKNSMQKGRK